MSLGRCQFMTCTSMLGTERLCDVFTFRNRVQQHRILVCPECRVFIDDAKKGGLALNITDEGAVYPDVWMRSLTSGA